jgi:oligopeptide/dipeptide ABC transporter ATP-binding protein
MTSDSSTGAPLLQVRDLRIAFPTPSGPLPVVTGISFDLNKGETLGIVGESGSGKTVTALSIMGLLRRAGAEVGGSVQFRGEELIDAPESRLRELRGPQIAMVFQDATASLNPTLTIGEQITETLFAHRQISRRAALDRAAELLDLVGIPSARLRLRAYPHELSGGMRQRAMIAIALSCEPSILIADEPTTALDVTVQAQILDLMRSLQAKLGMGILFITHDLAVVADICDRVLVMYAGEAVEESAAVELYDEPRHPYTEALLASTPHMLAAGGPRLKLASGGGISAVTEGCRFAKRCTYAEADCHLTHPELTLHRGRPARCLLADRLTLKGTAAALGADQPVERSRRAARPAAGVQPVVEASDVNVTFNLRRSLLSMGRPREAIVAVDGVGITLQPREVLAIVGESGSGKSTLARAIVGLTPYKGRIKVNGADRAALDSGRRRKLGGQLQMVFQDPYSSLDPTATVSESIAEPLEVHEQLDPKARAARIAELLEAVGLRPEHAWRFPNQLSGGQRQRVAIARAIALHPSVVIADEAVSGLDVSTKMQVIDLLDDLSKRMEIAYIFITHDLALGRQIADRVAVMYFGKIVETGPVEEIFSRPAHPYTLGLLSSVPVPDPRLQRQRRSVHIAGELPSSIERPSGCSFHTRCPFVMDVCRELTPALVEIAPGREASCHLNGGRGLEAEATAVGAGATASVASLDNQTSGIG